MFKQAIKSVVDAEPDVLNHNIEATKNIFDKVRPKGDYVESLALLKYVKEVNPNQVTKSGFMVGLGESVDDVIQTLKEQHQMTWQIRHYFR